MLLGTSYTHTPKSIMKGGLTIGLTISKTAKPIGPKFGLETPRRTPGNFTSKMSLQKVKGENGGKNSKMIISENYFKIIKLCISAS